jgi:isocitrate/isopropylmalate dehydrogenase
VEHDVYSAKSTEIIMSVSRAAQDRKRPRLTSVDKANIAGNQPIGWRDVVIEFPE